MGIPREQAEQAGLREWEPLEFGPQHMQMLMMRAAGMRPKEIAEATGYSQSRVSVILNDPRAKKLIPQLTGQMLREFQLDVREMIQSYSGEATETIGSLMRHAESEQVRLASAKDLLDRAGFKPKEVVQHTHVEIGADDAKRILAAIMEAREPEPELEFIQDSSEVFRPVGSILPGPAPLATTSEPDGPDSE